jgi:cytochrome d ubiquinol oxidase subunit I
MQHPVGYHLVTDAMGQVRAEMIDFGALLTNANGWYKFFHTVTSGYVVAAFFVMGISAWHLLRKNNLNFFKRSFRTAAVFGLASTIAVAATGDFSAIDVAKHQPAKLAAMEAVWDTQKGVDFFLLLVPDSDAQRNSVEAIGIPNMVSILAFHKADAEVKGLKDFPRDLRPPVAPTFWSFRLMVAMGMYMILISAIGVWLSRKPNLEDYGLFLKIMLFSLPVPYVAGQLGWIVAEVGRQPWIVYGVLKTADGVSRSISTAQIVASLLGFTLFYGSLGVLDVYLLTKFAKKGPDGDIGGFVKMEGRRR